MKMKSIVLLFFIHLSAIALAERTLEYQHLHSILFNNTNKDIQQRIESWFNEGHHLSPEQYEDLLVQLISRNHEQSIIELFTKQILSSGIDLHQFRNALNKAITEKRSDTILWLLEKRVLVQSTQGDRVSGYRLTPLFQAISNKLVLDTMIALLNHHPSFDTLDPIEASLYLEKALLQNNVELAQLLVEKDAFILEDKKADLLIDCASKGHAKSVEFILTEWLPPSSSYSKFQYNKNILQALLKAIDGDHLETVKTLTNILENIGAVNLEIVYHSPDKSSSIPLIRALQNSQNPNNFEITEFLIQHPITTPYFFINGEKDFYLHWMIKNNIESRYIERVLQSHRDSIDQVNNFGESPIHLAIEHKNLKALILLIRYNVQVGTLDANNITAFDKALIVGDKKIIRFLRKEKARSQSFAQNIITSCYHVFQNIKIPKIRHKK